jgi:hypothetical protein
MSVAGSYGAVGEHIDVMDEKDIDTIESQALERVLERTHDTIVCVVVSLFARRGVEELADSRPFRSGAGTQEATDLGRDYV